MSTFGRASPPPRRRPMTYGRQRPKQAFQYNFEDVDTSPKSTSLLKSPSRASKSRILAYRSEKSVRSPYSDSTKSSEDVPDIFDVPSDDGSRSREVSPALEMQLLRDTDSLGPEETADSSAPAKHDSLLDQPLENSIHDSKKRKRIDLFRPSSRTGAAKPQKSQSAPDFRTVPNEVVQPKVLTTTLKNTTTKANPQGTLVATSHKSSEIKDIYDLSENEDWQPRAVQPKQPKKKTQSKPVETKSSGPAQVQKRSRFVTTKPAKPKTIGQITKRTAPRTPPSPLKDAMEIDAPVSPAATNPTAWSVPPTPEREQSVEVVLPSTPKAQTGAGSTVVPASRTHSTPRQRQAWDNLFARDGGRTPATALNKLTLKSARKTEPTTAQKAEGRKRLIDTLKPSEDEGLAETLADLEHISDDSSASHEGGSSTDDPPASQNFTATAQQPSSQSQTKSQLQLQPNSQSQISSLKKTYGGPRSYLEDSPMTLEQMLSQPLDVDQSPAYGVGKTEVRQKLQQKSRLSMMVDDSEDEEEDKSKVKSIHELRARGDNQRFELELSLLLDELEQGSHSSFSSRRNALLEIYGRFTDPSFRDRLLHTGLETRMFRAGVGIQDVMSRSYMAAILVEVLFGSSSLPTVFNIFQIVRSDFASEAFHDRAALVAVAKERKMNMSKVAQMSVAVFEQNVLLSPAWKASGVQKITPCLLQLKGLETLVRRMREANHEVPVLQDRGMLGMLFRTLEDTFSEDLGTLTAADSAVAFVEAELALSILESATTDSTCAMDGSIWSSVNVERLARILDKAVTTSTANSQSLHNLAIRLCINLANNNKVNCDIFAKTSFVAKLVLSINRGLATSQQLSQSSEASQSLSSSSEAAAEHGLSEEGLAAFDNLLLAMGALINLAEWSDMARTAVVAPTSTSSFDSMITHFINIRKHVSDAASLAASRANVAGGYLAVLLGNLCQTSTVRTRVKSRLSKVAVADASADEKAEGSLTIIIDAIEEFIRHNQQVDKKASETQGEEGNEAWTAFTERIRAVAETLREIKD